MVNYLYDLEDIEENHEGLCAAAHGRRLQGGDGLNKVPARVVPLSVDIAAWSLRLPRCAGRLSPSRNM
jgi:hypothetical protein